MKWLWTLAIASMVVGSFELGRRIGAVWNDNLTHCNAALALESKERHNTTVMLDMCEKDAIRNIREQNEWMVKQTQIVQRMRAKLSAALDAKCNHLVIDTEQEYSAQQLREATIDYAECLGVDVIDWCELPKAERERLSFLADGPNIPTGECPDAL